MIKPFYLDLSADEIAAIQEKLGEILASGTLILGPYTEQFESEFASYIGCQHAVAVNSGTSALEVLLTIKGAKGKRIAVPTNTNFASVAAIIRAGGQPVFMDMQPDYFVPDLDILQATMEKRPHIAGVLWVHIGGIIAPDFQDVVEYCRSNGLFLIEDAAHAHGSQINGVKAGNLADGAAFSFFPTKVMTTMEGGMVTTNSEEEANLVRSFRNQGKRAASYGGLHSDLGNSWRISEIAAYIGLVQLAKLDQMIARRQQAVDHITPVLRERDIAYCDTSHMDRASQYKFIIKYANDESVDDLKAKFADRGVILGGGVYEVPCHMQPVFQDIACDRREMANAERFCPRHICPPVTSGTSMQEVAAINEAIIHHLT